MEMSCDLALGVRNQFIKASLLANLQSVCSLLGHACDPFKQFQKTQKNV
jgi:hypothetical protein